MEYCREFDYFCTVKTTHEYEFESASRTGRNLRVVAFDVRHRTGVSDHGGRVLLFRQPVQHRSRRRVRHGHRPAQRLSLDSGRYVRLYDRRSAAGERHHRFRPAVRRPHALRRLPHAGSDKPALVDRLSQPGGARSARSQAALRRCDRPVERPDARVAAGSRAHRSGSGVGAAQSGYDRRYGHHRHVSAKNSPR